MGGEIDEASADLRHTHVQGPLCSKRKTPGSAVHLRRAHADIGKDEIGPLPPCKTCEWGRRRGTPRRHVSRGMGGEEGRRAMGRSPTACSAAATSPNSPRCTRARGPYSARRRPANLSACTCVSCGRRKGRGGVPCAATPPSLGPARAALQQGSNRAWKARGPHRRRCSLRFCPPSGSGRRRRSALAQTGPGRRVDICQVRHGAHRAHPRTSPRSTGTW